MRRFNDVTLPKKAKKSNENGQTERKRMKANENRNRRKMGNKPEVRDGLDTICSVVLSR